MTGITSGLGGPRWTPALDAAAAALIHADRQRPVAEHPDHAQVMQSDRQGEDGEQRRGGERRHSPSAPAQGGAPDPSGNAGRRLDAFA